MTQIIKGSEDYKKAQSLANKIVRYASYNRWNNNSIFEMAYNALGAFICEIKKLNTFASQIAETIDNKMNCFGKQVAYVSDKQAWILACTAVENNINLEF